MMKTVVQLDRKDLQLIVAERFGVPINKVTVTCKGIPCGYLADEHLEYVPYCEVERIDNKELVAE